MVWARPISSELIPPTCTLPPVPQTGGPSVEPGLRLQPPPSEVGAQEGAASWVGRPGVALLPSSPTFSSFALTPRYECHLEPGPRPL